MCLNRFIFLLLLAAPILFPCGVAAVATLIFFQRFLACTYTLPQLECLACHQQYSPTIMALVSLFVPFLIMPIPSIFFPRNLGPPAPSFTIAIRIYL